MYQNGDSDHNRHLFGTVWNICKRAIKDATSQLVDRMRHCIAPNVFGSHDNWRFYNGLLNKSKSTISYPCTQFHVLTSNKADCFSCKFHLNSTTYSSGLPLPDIPARNETLLNDMHITPANVSANISQLDPHKECKLAGILATDLKKSSRVRFPVFSKLYTKWFAASFFPASWTFCRSSL